MNFLDHLSEAQKKELLSSALFSESKRRKKKRSRRTKPIKYGFTPDYSFNTHELMGKGKKQMKFRENWLDYAKRFGGKGPEKVESLKYKKSDKNLFNNIGQ